MEKRKRSGYERGNNKPKEKSIKSEKNTRK